MSACSNLGIFRKKSGKQQQAKQHKTEPTDLLPQVIRRRDVMHFARSVFLVLFALSPAAAANVTLAQLQTQINSLNSTIMAQANALKILLDGQTDTNQTLNGLKSSNKAFLKTLSVLIPIANASVAGAGMLSSQTSSLTALNPFLTVVNQTLNGLPGPHVLLEQINLNVRSGGGSTYGTAGTKYAGLGNIIVGYDDVTYGAARTGSNSVVVGDGHQLAACGVLAAGYSSTVGAGADTSVTFGASNTVSSGSGASVLGGTYNDATGPHAVIAGGSNNQALTATAPFIGGGFQNLATADFSSVLAGRGNQAYARASTVLGGRSNTATASSAVNNQG